MDGNVLEKKCLHVLRCLSSYSSTSSFQTKLLLSSSKFLWPGTLDVRISATNWMWAFHPVLGLDSQATDFAGSSSGSASDQ